MATENMVLSTSWPASGDLSSYQYHAVKISSGEVALCGDTDIPIGILQNQPDADGVAAEVGLIGISKAVVDGSTNVAIGDFLAVNSSGHLIKTTTASDQVVAQALEAVTADGIVAKVLLAPMSTYNQS
ncbi:MAG: DUF2190 family protein [Candidatus Thermoplasmatota archaeon]|nr:DUF2190 family protein [Candidatus Thermoplasmatota archaeon]